MVNFAELLDECELSMVFESRAQTMKNSSVHFEGRVQSKLETRFQKFFAGDWLDLISDTESVSRQTSSARVRKRRRPRPDGSAARVEKLIMMGELSAARHRLWSRQGWPVGQEHVERFEACSPKGAASSRDDDDDPSPSVRSP